MKIGADARLVPMPNVHARRFDDEIVVLDLDKGVYFSLDEVGAAVWEGFMRGQSLGEILPALAERYQVSREQLLADTEKLVGRLLDAGLAVLGSDGEST